jgi:hypothetical protein
MHVKDRGSDFKEVGFPHNITMTLARLEPWEWSAVNARAVRQAAAIREGAAAIEIYGFEADEFDSLKDPDTWAGIAEFIFAVELGMKSIRSWTGVQRAGEADVAPVELPVVARLFRLKDVREHFLAIMAREGERYLAAEGNA